MIFNTYQFAVFFAIVYALYFVLRHRYQNWMILFASYVFYGAWDYRFLSLIWISTILDFYCARQIGKTDEQRKKKHFLMLSLAGNLGILGFFKYFNFFAESLQEMGALFNYEFEPWLLSIALPVGISFYTFQTMSYTIDVYYGKQKPERNILYFALFVAFFPQLVAGPIERASTLIPQFKTPRKLTSQQFNEGCWLIVWGLYKKAFVANNLAYLVDRVYGSPADYSAPWVILATYAFAIQVYCDFSGYTDIARGVAKVMGFDLRHNFNQPYFSADPKEHWQRWHISLSEWLRDYVYIPLGGNRKGRARREFNIFSTMAISGLWHGAGWTYVLWGIYQGVMITIYSFLWNDKPRGWSPEGVKRTFYVFAWFNLTCLGYVLFRAEHISDVGIFASTMVSNWEIIWYTPEGFRRALMQFIAFSFVLVILEFIMYFKKDLNIVLRWPWPVKVIVYLILYFSLTIFGAFDGRQFVYFQF